MGGQAQRTAVGAWNSDGSRVLSQIVAQARTQQRPARVMGGEDLDTLSRVFPKRPHSSKPRGNP